MKPLVVALAVAVTLGAGMIAHAICRGVKSCAKACDRGDGEACRALGDRHRNAGEPDHEAAVAAYQRGCDHGDQRACVELGVAIGAGFGAERSTGRAAALFAAACRAGDVVGCHDLATLASEQLKRGEGVDPLDLGELCCAGFAAACPAVAELWDRGFRPPGEGAAAHFTAACAAGDARACQVAGAAGDVTARYQEACDDGVAAACGRLAWALASDGQPRAEERGAAAAQRAAKLAKKPCGRGDAWACYVRFQALDGLALRGDEPKGLDAARKAACDAGFRRVCHPAAQI